MVFSEPKSHECFSASGLGAKFRDAPQVKFGEKARGALAPSGVAYAYATPSLKRSLRSKLSLFAFMHT